MTTPLKLTDKQLMLLSAASQQEDRRLALPETLKGGAAKAVVSKLLSAGLVEEIPVSPADPHWRKDDEDQSIGLRITPSSLLVIGIEPHVAADAHAESGDTPQSAERQTEPVVPDGTPPTPAPRQQREGTKRALIVMLLSREQGATMDDLIKATGWLPHTTRAALTGLRQSGYAIIRTRAEDNRTVYRLAAAAEPASVQPASAKAEI